MPKEEDVIELPDNKKLLLSQFIYSEYHNHQISIYQKYNKVEKIWSSQTEFLKLLEPYHYLLSINPGVIINLNEVIAVNDEYFEMSTGCNVPFSKRKKKELIHIYNNYLFDQLRKEKKRYV